MRKDNILADKRSQHQSEVASEAPPEETSPQSDGAARIYERPNPPFFQRHPVVIIILASISLIVTATLVLFVY